MEVILECTQGSNCLHIYIYISHEHHMLCSVKHQGPSMLLQGKQMFWFRKLPHGSTVLNSDSNDTLNYHRNLRF